MGTKVMYAPRGLSTGVHVVVKAAQGGGLGAHSAPVSQKQGAAGVSLGWEAPHVSPACRNTLYLQPPISHQGRSGPVTFLVPTPLQALL